jgi:hypothetical protein
MRTFVFMRYRTIAFAENEGAPLWGDQRILYDLKEGTLLVSRNPVTFFNQIFA